MIAKFQALLPRSRKLYEERGKKYLEYSGFRLHRAQIVQGSLLEVSELPRRASKLKIEVLAYPTL